jgi:hypothetical protein
LLLSLAVVAGPLSVVAGNSFAAAAAVVVGASCKVQGTLLVVVGCCLPCLMRGEAKKQKSKKAEKQKSKKKAKEKQKKSK